MLKIRRLISVKRILISLFLLCFIAFGGALYWAKSSGPESLINRIGAYALTHSPLAEDMFIFFPTVRSFFGFEYAGDARFDYLTETFYRKILIEIDWTEGFTEAETVGEVAKDFLAEYCHKSGGVEIHLSDAIPSVMTSLTNDKVETLVSTHRDFYSGGGTSVVYILVVDEVEAPACPYAPLGQAFGAEEVVLYKERVEDLSRYELIRKQLYRSVVAHELGHLFGLGHHSVDDELCLMDERVHYASGYNFDDWIWAILNDPNLTWEEGESFLEDFLPAKLSCKGEIEAFEKMRGIQWIIWK